MGIIDESRAIIQSLEPDWYGRKVAAIDMLRLDLLHPVISGNKWYKLRLNVKHAIERGFKTIVTTGGGYSNHLVATAFAAKAFGLHSIGVVRGNYEVLTPTLEECRNQGMELIFASKEDYQSRHEPEWARRFVEHFDEILMIPEGGANEWGRAGAGLINRFIKDNYTHIAVAVGTGTTLIGIRNKTNIKQTVLGFAPMKQGTYLKEYISEHLLPGSNRNWELFDTWHFGGFAKWNEELIQFINDFYKVNHIPLDMVYTSKMMYGVRQMAQNNFFREDDKLLCIHSGGLQGNVTIKNRLDF